MNTPTISSFPGRACSAAARLAVVGLVSLAALDSTGAPITIEFGGQVTDAGPTTAFSPGDVLSGSFTYDPTSLDSDPGAINIFAVPATVSGVVRGYSFASRPASLYGRIEFIELFDEDTIRALMSVEGNPVEGLPLVYFSMDVARGVPDLIADIDHPPLDPLPLIPGGEFLLSFYDLNQVDDPRHFGQMTVLGTITELRVKGSANPSLPDGGGTLSLMGLACASLMVARGGVVERGLR